VAKNIALLHLNNGAVEEMEVGTADCAAGHLENDVAILDNDGARDCDHLDFVLALPDESLHGLRGVTILGAITGGVGDILAVKG